MLPHSIRIPWIFVFLFGHSIRNVCSSSSDSTSSTSETSCSAADHCRDPPLDKSICHTSPICLYGSNGKVKCIVKRLPPDTPCGPGQGGVCNGAGHCSTIYDPTEQLCHFTNGTVRTDTIFVGPTRFYKQPQEAIASLQGRVICPTVISLDDGTYDGPLDISGFSSSNGLYTHRRENTTQPTEFTLKIQGDTRILAGFNFVQGLPNWHYQDSDGTINPATFNFDLPGAAGMPGSAASEANKIIGPRPVQGVGSSSITTLTCTPGSVAGTTVVSVVVQMIWNNSTLGLFTPLNFSYISPTLGDQRFNRPGDEVVIFNADPALVVNGFAVRLPMNPTDPQSTIGARFSRHAVLSALGNTLTIAGTASCSTTYSSLTFLPSVEIVNRDPAPRGSIVAANCMLEGLHIRPGDTGSQVGLYITHGVTALLHNLVIDGTRGPIGGTGLRNFAMFDVQQEVIGIDTSAGAAQAWDYVNATFGYGKPVRNESLILRLNYVFGLWVDTGATLLMEKARPDGHPGALTFLGFYTRYSAFPDCPYNAGPSVTCRATLTRAGQLFSFGNIFSVGTMYFIGHAGDRGSALRQFGGTIVTQRVQCTACVQSCVFSDTNPTITTTISAGLVGQPAFVQTGGVSLATLAWTQHTPVGVCARFGATVTLSTQNIPKQGSFGQTLGIGVWAAGGSRIILAGTTSFNYTSIAYKVDTGASLVDTNNAVAVTSNGVGTQLYARDNSSTITLNGFAPLTPANYRVGTTTNCGGAPLVPTIAGMIDLRSFLPTLALPAVVAIP